MCFWNDAGAAFGVLINNPGLFVQEEDVIGLESDDCEIAGSETHGEELFAYNIFY